MIHVQVLDYHNKLRSALAQGRTRQPGASDMLELSWDEELAWEAQAHADTCRWGHDCSSCRRLQRWRSVGQNLYQSYRCCAVQSQVHVRVIETKMQ